MRHHDIIFGIFLLLPIIDLALAVPIPTQEKRQSINVPTDMVTGLEKRGVGDDEIEKLAEYFKNLKLEDPHASSSSPPAGPEHESTSNAQTSSSPPQGHELGPMKDEQASGPVPETAASAAPNPLVEPSNPLSTEPSTYTPASTDSPSYSSTEYSSDAESTKSHPPHVEPYPPEWDIWLNPQDHAGQEEHLYQPGSPPPPTGFAHGDDVHQPLPQHNGFAHGDDVHQQPPQQNGFAHGDAEHQPLPPQQNIDPYDQVHVEDAASSDSSTYYAPTLTSSGHGSTGVPELNQAIVSYNEWLGMDAWHHVHQMGPQPLQQGTQELQHLPPPEYYLSHPWPIGDELAHVHMPPPWPQGTDDLQHLPPPEYFMFNPSRWPDQGELVHIHQPNPLPQGDNVAHGTQVDDVPPPPPPQGDDVSHGAQ